MKTFESDVCIIGGGISAALLSQKLSELAPDVSITVVEAGQKIFDFENRMAYRQRMLDYEENPWPGDFIEDQTAENIISFFINNEFFNSRSPKCRKILYI